MPKAVYIMPLLFVLVQMKGIINCSAQIKRIVVAKEGKGDYTSIQAAIASLPDSAAETRIIYIKKGTYNEKVYIEKHNLLLQGEDRENVVLSHSIAREEWRCKHADDWGVATLNIDGNDVTLQDLTIINSFGFDWKVDKTVFCSADTSYKLITRTGHQMAVRTMAATRFKAIRCTFRSYAGDTMSPWNTANGLFYFKDCTMEGGVDFYCPRGWAYAEGCTFIATKGDAAIWHDGSIYEDSKTVLNKCHFQGYDGFQLGRYHRDAQFYLLNCTFAENMADKAIYRVTTNNTIRWGHRVYYYNCHKKGGDYAWFADNISSSETTIDPKTIDSGWVFGNKWNPTKN